MIKWCHHCTSILTNYVIKVSDPILESQVEKVSNFLSGLPVSRWRLRINLRYLKYCVEINIKHQIHSKSIFCMYVGLTQFDALCAVPLKLDQIGEVQIEAPNYEKISFWSPQLHFYMPIDSLNLLRLGMDNPTWWILKNAIKTEPNWPCNNWSSKLWENKFWILQIKFLYAYWFIKFIN